MESRQSTGHRIKRNHCNCIPRYIVAFDTETLPTADDASGRRFSHRWRLATAIYARIVDRKPIGKKVERFKSPDDWWKFLYGLTGPRHTVWVIAHNALFDLVVARLPAEFLQSRMVIDAPRSKRTREDNDIDNVHCHGLAVIESPPTILGAKCVATQGRIVFVDSLNWFPQTLASLGTALGKEKHLMPSFDRPDSEWFPYCERDSEITFDTFLELIRWVADNDMGMFRYTAASQAMSAYRHRFMRHNILVHDNQPIKQVERRAYFGGRTEVFRMGEIRETVHQYDVNSLFPATMRSGYFPWRLDRFEVREEYLPMLPSIEWGASVAEVIVRPTDAMLPYRTKEMVIYPRGEFKTSLCGMELAHAHRQGWIVGCRSWAEYAMADLFSDWVETLWGMRKGYKAIGNNLYAEFAKRLLNSLYGKFGQLAHEWVNVPGPMPAEPWSQWSHYDGVTGNRVCYRSIGWQVQKRIERRRYTEREIVIDGRPAIELEETTTELDSSFPAISAFVTSSARMTMEALRRIAGRGNVYYQGVDSLVVTTAGRDNLVAAKQIDGDRLGALRYELSTNNGEIYGCSDYRLGEKVVIAGRGKTWYDPEIGQLLQRKFSASNHLFDGSPVDYVAEESQPWERSAIYGKGSVQVDGWVEPLELKV